MSQYSRSSQRRESQFIVTLHGVDDGDTFIEVITAPIVNQAGEVEHVIETRRDVTERQRAVEALRQAKAAAEQANRGKDHLMAVLSHELRTPLTPVMMGLSMLQDRADFDQAVRGPWKWPAATWEWRPG